MCGSWQNNAAVPTQRSHASTLFRVRLAHKGAGQGLPVVAKGGAELDAEFPSLPDVSLAMASANQGAPSRAKGAPIRIRSRTGRAPRGPAHWRRPVDIEQKTGSRQVLFQLGPYPRENHDGAATTYANP